jgi:hypothetical protein
MRTTNYIKQINSHIQALHCSKRNKLFKFIVVLLSLFVFSFSFRNGDIKLIQCTSEKWVSGIRGGGSGTEFYVKVKINTNKKIVFDSLWVNNRWLSIFLLKTSKSISQTSITFAKNDTIIVRASQSNSNQATLLTVPKEINGDGLLRYFVNGKVKHLLIKKIEPIRTNYRP